jgi:hypothetical protein
MSIKLRASNKRLTMRRLSVPGRPPGSWRRLGPEAEARSRQIQQTVSGGALGGGMLLAGFGLLPALIGASAGALLGYLFERQVDAKQARHPA